MAGSSEVAFKAALDSLEIGALYDTFKKEGWKTFVDFAFSTSDPKGQDPQAFEKEVIQALLGTPHATEGYGDKKPMIPRIRRLYAQAYTYAAKEMQDEADPKAEDKITMHPTDRASRTEGVRQKITGFKVLGMNMPAHKLCDLFATILAKDIVRYVPWEKCISRDQETTEETESKGLKVSKEGLLMQDVAPDSHTNLSGEFLWDYALRRRSLAADIGGLMRFEVADAWTETLKQHVLKTPPPGHKRVSWAQVKAADEALWTFVQRKCETSTKAKPGENVTAFETAWKEGVYDYEVRQHLCFLQGPSASSSGSSGLPSFVPSTGSTHDQTVTKLTNRLRNAEQQIQAQKRKLGDGGGNGGGGNAGKRGKGTGKGKSRNKNAPQHLFPGCKAMINGKNVCYAYNCAGGCPFGASCKKGSHICIKCGGNHSYAMPCPNL